VIASISAGITSRRGFIPAKVEMVLPNIYDAQAADTKIVPAIGEMAQGRIDAITLTSSGQVRRLVGVAQAHGCEKRLHDGF
jgi:uroporphyrinogen-III synthase